MWCLSRNAVGPYPSRAHRSNAAAPRPFALRRTVGSVSSDLNESYRTFHILSGEGCVMNSKLSNSIVCTVTDFIPTVGNCCALVLQLVRVSVYSAQSRSRPFLAIKFWNHEGGFLLIWKKIALVKVEQKNCWQLQNYWLHEHSLLIRPPRYLFAPPLRWFPTFNLRCVSVKGAGYRRRFDNAITRFLR